jgi:hypothetical protein
MTIAGLGLALLIIGVILWATAVAAHVGWVLIVIGLVLVVVGVVAGRRPL